MKYPNKAIIKLEIKSFNPEFPLGLPDYKLTHDFAPDVVT